MTVLTAGSRGDVEPYVALGGGLADAGFTVRLATHAGFRDLAASRSLEFAEVATAGAHLASDERWNALQHQGDTAGRFVRRWRGVGRLARPLLDALLDDHWAACQGTDAVVSSIAAFGGPHMAAALGVPHAWALVQPVSPTRERPHLMAPGRPRLPALLNRSTYRVADRVYAGMFHGALNRWLAANVGGRRAAVPRDGLFGPSAGPIVYGISPSVLPPARDWPRTIVQRGYWFLEPGDDAPLPGEVAEFLAAGPPPVFVHAARIGAAPPAELAALVVRTLRRLGLRGLLSGPPPAEALPESVLATPPVPFHRLFPRVAAVVHHGGAGTTAAALRAGVPSLGIPGFFDQAFWSARVAALGAGPLPLPGRRLTQARLEAALARLVGDPSFRARARELGRRIRAERGTADTAAHLRDVLGAGA